MSDTRKPGQPGDRLAKVIARSGLCSRRDAEDWIKGGRVAVNGTVIRTPAFNVTAEDKIKVDGTPLATRKGTRVWLYHKPPGLVVTEKDPEGRQTIFEKLAAEGLPRVLTIGRLDINTEGLLLLTNDGGLKRVLELPATGWLRRYRVRAFGTITQAQLDVLKDGIEIEGVKYGPIEAVLERQQGANVWLVVALREGKNREVKNVLGVLGLTVNRLIRVSYGPFQLGDLPIGGIEVVKARVLREQLGKKLADEAGVDFESEMPEPAAVAKVRAADPTRRAAAPGKEPPARARRAFGAERPQKGAEREERPIRHRPGRADMTPPRKPRPDKPLGPARRILFDDGREEEFHPAPPRDDKKGKFGDKPAGKFGDKPRGTFGDKPPGRPGGKPRGDRPAADRPPRKFGDMPAGKFGSKPIGKFGDKPRGPRPPGKAGDRPPRRDDDRPRPAGAARPERKSFGARDDSRRPSTAPARSARPGGPPRGPRPAGPARPGGPARSPRPSGPPRGPRPGGSRPPPRKPRP